MIPSPTNPVALIFKNRGDGDDLDWQEVEEENNVRLSFPWSNYTWSRATVGKSEGEAKEPSR
jgi:hypothetical protein